MRWATAINECRDICPKVSRLSFSAFKSGDDLYMTEKQTAVKHVNETKRYMDSH